MKSLIKALFVVLVVTVCRTAIAQSNPVTVAVLDFDSGYKVKRHIVTDLVTATLSADPQLAVVDRATLKKALDEQALGMSGTISPEQAAQVGHITGAQVLISGRLFKKGNGWAIISQIISSESGRVFTENTDQPGDVTKVSEEIAKKLAQTINANRTNLLARRESREDRLAQILQGIKSDKRPVLSIKINEKNSETNQFNSTVETELGFLLQKAGFTIVDEKSGTKPGLEILGEATVEVGQQKGDFFSGRAIVELKVRELSTGKIICFDRQKSTGVDIGKQSATKAALESAADELAFRLIPLLAQ